MRRLISGAAFGAWLDPPTQVVPTERPTAAARRRWHAARLFQNQAQRALASLHVKFIEWLLLESLAELCEEKQDAVSQAAIAERAGVAVSIVSYWMDVMEEEGFADRGPDMDGRAYRIILTELGEQTLQCCNERLEASLLTA